MSDDMGESAEKCLWDATRRNCVEWCREHVSEWSSFLVDVIKASKDEETPISLFLPSGFAFKKGLSIMPDIETKMAQYDRHSIEAVEVVIIAIGIKSTHKPTQEIIDEWELLYKTSCDIVSLAATSMCPTSSEMPPLYLVARDDTSNPQKDSLVKYMPDQLSEAMVSFMTDPTIHAPRLLFAFNISLGRWDTNDCVALCDFLDSKIHPITGEKLYTSVSDYKGRKYALFDRENPNTSFSTEETSSGVANLLMKLKNGIVAEWRSVVNCLLYVPSTSVNRPVTVEVSFSW